MKNSYHYGTGTYQKLTEALDTLVPDMGGIKGNPKLETYRLASNAYYDLWNNGGGNLDGDILVFARIWEDAECNRGQSFFNGDCDMLGGHEWGEVCAAFEPEMDRITMDAAIEQIEKLANIRNGLAKFLGDLGKGC
jgi:hypothetical protein